MKLLRILLVALCFSVNVAFASYRVCFTPGEDCTGLIVQTIDEAQKSIFVQAYSFTSPPILHALLLAKRRGVDVQVILDKSHIKNKQYSAATFFTNHQIPLLIDYKPDIAHNKVMIIDKSTVITGSFNFTKAAQFRNAENVLVINDPELAMKYWQNWQSRAAAASADGMTHPVKLPRGYSKALKKLLNNMDGIKRYKI